MPIATPEVYAALIDRAKAGRFAYPAVNVTSSQTITMTVEEPSEPEILVVQPGRAITADDTAMVAGAIETKRAKRRTDA